MSMYEIEPEEPESTASPLWSLDRDLRKAAATLGPNEVRYLVDSYYAAQDLRKQAKQRLDAAAKAGEPNELMIRLYSDTQGMENNLKYALKKWGDTSEISQWATSISGIGPVISAGLAAHIDISQCPTAGHIWSFAGLNPEAEWKKGEKRPWNADLKWLCWKIGESFVKVSNKPDDYYGKVYKDRKALEIERNEAGLFAEQAAVILKRVPNHKQKATYAEGKLPDSHIHSRAKRYAVKLFLSHWHHVAYEIATGEKPPKPYIFSEAAALKHGEHVHMLEPPNWPMPVGKR